MHACPRFCARSSLASSSPRAPAKYLSPFLEQPSPSQLIRASLRPVLANRPSVTLGGFSSTPGAGAAGLS
eukprot:6611626-Pyramimonas_sp.AAC.1